MKIFQIFLTAHFILLPMLIFAQDTIFYNENNNKVPSRQQADYYKTLVKENIGPSKLIERQYYLNGQMKEEIYYQDLSQKKKEGAQRYWYRNGQLKGSVDYLDNKMNGTILTYWQNGHLKRKDRFENNKFVSGACYDSTGNKIEHFDYLVYPSFPGGEKVLLDYIKNNLRYPPTAAENGIQGRVVVKFVVKKDGTPTDFSIMKRIDRDLDKEAYRVVSGMPKWIPGFVDGESIDFWYVLPVAFKMMENRTMEPFPSSSAFR